MLLWLFGCTHLFNLVFLGFIFFLSDENPETELLGYIGILFLVFQQTIILFSHSGAPIYITTNSVQ